LYLHAVVRLPDHLHLLGEIERLAVEGHRDPSSAAAGASGSTAAIAASNKATTRRMNKNAHPRGKQSDAE
jgi:hypothetical protein